ncbi:MAG: hypothetical protein PHQ22_08455 [Sulfuricurvum sp.]|nr:hypothetical protein [Sulfuricurvum sp.]MDD5387208.1 hypothetical protein [Sulfuricurvum sp.]
MLSRTLRSVLMLSLLSIPLILSAELKNENLLQSIPTGYKIDYQIKQKNLIMMEMVPDKQSVNNWDEMVTTQIMLGLKNVTPETFQSSMQKMWSDTCKNSQFVTLKQGKENSYPFSFWLQLCPMNPSTGKAEITWFKAIQGNDSFYVVQKAFKFEPSEEQVTQWTQYLRSVTVCDTRLPNSLCPKLQD